MINGNINDGYLLPPTPTRGGPTPPPITPTPTFTPTWTPGFTPIPWGYGGAFFIEGFYADDYNPQKIMLYNNLIYDNYSPWYGAGFVIYGGGTVIDMLSIGLKYPTEMKIPLRLVILVMNGSTTKMTICSYSMDLYRFQTARLALSTNVLNHCILIIKS
ncbi:MAG: hypothetical protein A2161_10560 [Candidatus Schekmanbacteria bacterium RBG_13_48_7]|uniref:Uncharacterized protein n=1 Tax=Candidatus Schekmanbacteria bacterium RBG_13_48_7 TaxID=1817878 RepID=A0A1F7RVH9_9BACT|nr:MAG: hypothetical protein A2161_10560 [Candidatus Schekmanbacteria bacterium RBG_13_48_7]